MTRYPIPPLSYVARAGIALALAALFLPAIAALAPAGSLEKFAYLQHLPDAMVDTTLRAELTLGEAYLGAAYAGRDLAAAAYGGVALQYVAGVEAALGAYARGIGYMGDSMAQGAFDVQSGAAAVGLWYRQGTTNIDARLRSAEGR